MVAAVADAASAASVEVGTESSAEIPESMVAVPKMDLAGAG